MRRYLIKVVHICPIGITAKKLLLPQCTYLRNMGYEVSFVFSPSPETGELRELGFSVEELPITRGRIAPADFASILKLREYLASAKPGIVHTHTDKGGGVGRIAARLAGVPCVIHTVHGYAFDEGQSSIKNWAYSLIERELSRHTDIVLSQSIEDVETAKHLRIRARAGYPIWIGNGVDTSLFDRSRFGVEAQAGLRSRLRIGQEPVITIVARLTFEKGYRELVEALAACTELQWTALFVGREDRDGAAIQRLIQQHGISDRVRLIGDSDEIPLLLSISDLFVLPSYTEGVPRTVIEAQCMALPAVVTDVRGCREVVVHRETGLVVEPKDSVSLASAMRAAIQDPVMRMQYGAKAAARARKLFSEDAVFRRIESAYELAERVIG
jgi:glycosyltransferase involved in cell wall biosynthesis